RGVTLRARPLENDFAKFDLTLAARRDAEGLELSLNYAAALFDRRRMAQMVGLVRNALAALAASSQTRLSELHLLSADDERHLLIDWNGAPSSRAWGAVHELFEAQAARRP